MASKTGRSNALKPDDGKLIAAKNKLLQDPNHERALANVRRVLPASKYSALIHWLYSRPFLARRALHPPFPASLQDLKNNLVFLPGSVYRDIHWAGALLMPVARKLAEFCQRQQGFDRAFIVGDYAACGDLLDSIGRDFGQSLWFIKRRIAFLQASQGLDAQKQFSRSVEQENVPGNISAYIAHYVSVRNEPSVDPQRFAAQYVAQSRALRLPPDFAAYLQFHILPSADWNTGDAMAILRHESAGAAIDLYEALLAVSPVLIETDEEVRQAILSVLRSLHAVLNDPRLDSVLLHATGRGRAVESISGLTTATVALIRGDHIAALSAARNALANVPSSPVVLEIAALSAALKDVGPGADTSAAGRTLADRLVVQIARLMRHDPGEREAISALQKTRLNFHGAPWADLLDVVVRRETSDEPIASANAGVRRQTMLLPGVHALWLDRLPPERRAAYAAFVAAGVLDEPVISAYAQAGTEWNDEATTLPEMSFAELRRAELAYERGVFGEAAERAHGLAELPHALYRQRAARIECCALLAVGRLDECVVRLVDAVMFDQQAYTILPVARTVAALDHAARRRLAAVLAFPILLHIYGVAVSKERDNERADACEDFLTAHGLTRPSQLRDYRAAFKDKQLIYFLRHICVEAVLDLFTVFETSREVREERIEVCKLLAELDPDNTEIYHAEIRSLLRILTIQRRTREIEQSKIYVDTESLRRTADAGIRETFNRFRAFVQEGRMLGDLQLREVYEPADRSVGKIVYLKFSRNEVYDLFDALVTRLRDEYVSSTEHGLDAYLSVRIRHGTLAGQLRKPLEDTQLITQHDPASGTYRPNEYWRSRVAPCSPSVADAIEQRLFQFARAFDGLVQTMIKEWIQVRKRPEDKGLFDFSLDRQSVRVFAGLVAPDTTFEGFVDHLFLAFGNALDRNLQVVRQTIEEQAKAKVHELLTQLEIDLDVYAAAANIGGLSNAVRVARSQMQVAFDRIIAWFRRGRTVANEPFTFETAIDISAIGARTVSRGFEVHMLTPPQEDLKIAGPLLPIYDDILFLVFENIASRSRLPTPIGEIQYQVRGDVLRVRVENDVSPEAADTTARSGVETIRAGLSGGQFRRSVAREGGTGLHKLHKLLCDDLGLTPVLDFGFCGDCRFFVEFEIVTALPGRTT